MPTMSNNDASNPVIDRQVQEQMQMRQQEALLHALQNPAQSLPQPTFINYMNIRPTLPNPNDNFDGNFLFFVGLLLNFIDRERNHFG